MEKIGVVVLAGGRGSRMKKDIPKQYLVIEGKPLLYYSLAAFEQSEVSEITLVVGTGEIGYVKENIVRAYGFTKIKHIVEGGIERYHSVYEGLRAMKEDGIDYVLVHDGARPCLTRELICRTIASVKEFNACTVGVPTKDTIKITDEEGMVEFTPDRNRVWCVQTPQAFGYGMLLQAHDEMNRRLEAGEEFLVTDDAMVVERILQQKVKMVEGAYTNIKVTTPEDMILATQFINKSE